MLQLEKQTIKACSAQWIDEELNKVFMERNEAKAVFLRTKLESDQQLYRELRNYTL